MGEVNNIAAGSRRYPSPLRYPGGKGKIANFMKLLLLQNDVVGIDYVEPYAGGASVALSLLFEDFVDEIWINDVDRGVFAFWKAVLTDTRELCARVQETPLTVAEWERQRAVQAADDPATIDLAFSTFFLNRTNRSGIISGGLIGGRRQGGAWKLDARFNRSDLVRRIEKISRFSSRIHLSELDAAELLRQGEHAGKLLYLDPPYYAKGQDLYENFYTHQHHVQIARTMKEQEGPWLVSYDSVPEVRELYSFSSTSLEYHLAYSAKDRYRGREVMFLSAGLELPNGVEGPAGIPVSEVGRARRAAS